MNSILNNLPNKNREVIQTFLMSFKNKITEDLVNYQKVTEEIKKTAQRGIDTRLQLHQIDKETEKAATGIINRSEIIMERQNTITGIAKKLKSSFQKEEETIIPKFENLLLTILEIVRSSKTSNLEKSFTEKIKLMERDLIIMTADKLINQENLTDTIKQLDVNANENLDDLFEILNLCQFQDITSQELAKAHSLIKTIIDRMNYILMAFNIEGLEIKDDIKIKAYDSNASYSDHSNEQHEVDMLFQTVKQDTKQSLAVPASATPKASGIPRSPVPVAPAIPATPKISNAVPPKAAATLAPKSPAVPIKPVVPVKPGMPIAPNKEYDVFEQIKAEMKTKPSVDGPGDIGLYSEESGDDIFEQLQKELQINQPQVQSPSVDEVIEEQDELLDQFKELEEDITLEDTEESELDNQDHYQSRTSSDKNDQSEIDIDELAKKFESAGSGEIISQEEIDRILSGG